ncbi:kinesin-like protein Klp59C [Drosophila takahashii]|uniref:kinesin-like protein Klp59C n=1 Tax=Drosophila takahashii TaxID=29030 RepID=UPI001CF83411|nr:kinesin-like protein Klp59C [Drosophila takahashii]
MDRIKIGEQLFFQRSDGRIHPVVCTGKNPELDLITGEWTEGTVVKGKEVPISLLIGINRHIFAENQSQATGYAPQPPLLATASMIPKLRESSPNRGPLESHRKSIAGNPYAERMRAMDLRSKVTATKTEILGNSDQAGKNTSRLAFCKPRNTSPIQNRRSQGANNNTTTNPNQRCSSVVREVNRMKDEREKRRARQVEQLQEKHALRGKDPGNPNWEVSLMLRQYRATLNFTPLRCVNPNGAPTQQITVCVRKRPMSRKEESAKNMDIITVPSGDSLIVHELRFKVDLTKFLEHHKFRFDYTFDEQCSNSLVYDHTARPLIRTMFEGGNATCFAYGQTGSGKTHTMGGEFFGKIQDCGTGIYALAARDIFAEVSRPEYQKIGATVKCSFFEIYGSKVFDLLVSNKPMLRVLEDGKQQVVVVGLTEIPVSKVEEVLRLIELGSKERTSGQTSANAKSSRSHAVFQIALHMPNSWGAYGKCSFVDLAGNERGADTQSADRQTRIEGAEINKSLLALKECIRALSRQSSHLPFRGSKLTQVLRDSFMGGQKNKLCMIAMISPSMNCVEHTLNTLRYADRVKELIAKEAEALQNTTGDGDEKSHSDLNDESEPEMLAEEEQEEEQYEYEDNQHITISSEENSSYTQHNASSDTNFNHTVNMPHSSKPVELKEVAEQHMNLMHYLENFVRNFRGIETEEEFARYLRISDNVFEELLTVVNETRDLVLNFKTQQLIKDMMQKNNGKLEGRKKEEQED